MYGSRQGLRTRGDGVATPRLLRTPNVAAADLGLTVPPPGTVVEDDDDDDVKSPHLKVPGVQRRLKTPEVGRRWQGGMWEWGWDRSIAIVIFTHMHTHTCTP